MPVFKDTGIRTVTSAEAMLPVDEPEGVSVAITVPIPAPDAVKTPELVIVPTELGLTDHTTENPCGGLGDAVNVVLVPASSVIEDGLTANETGIGGGFEKPFSECEPLPQFVKLMKIRESARQIRKRAARC